MERRRVELFSETKRHKKGRIQALILDLNVSFVSRLTRASRPQSETKHRAERDPAPTPHTEAPGFTQSAPRGQTLRGQTQGHASRGSAGRAEP